MVEHLPEELGEGDYPISVVLGGPEVQIATDLCQALSNVETAPENIDSSSTQSGSFAPSQHPVGEDVDESPLLLLDFPRQLVDFRRGEEELFAQRLAGKVGVRGRLLSTRRRPITECGMELDLRKVRQPACLSSSSVGQSSPKLNFSHSKGVNPRVSDSRAM